MRLPKNLTLAQVTHAAKSNDGTGFCLFCGCEQGGCEPDAEYYYQCEACDELQVLGAEQLLILFS